MINKILLGIIYLISALVQLILTPIDSAITLALPDLSNSFTGIGNFLTIVFQSIGWCISLIGLSPDVISLIVIYYTFVLTVPLIFYAIKLALAWYNKLKV